MADHADPHKDIFDRPASSDHDMEKGGGMRVNVDELLKTHAVSTQSMPACHPALPQTLACSLGPC